MNILIYVIFAAVILTSITDVLTTNKVIGQGGHEDGFGVSAVFMAVLGKFWWLGRIGVPVVVLGLFWAFEITLAVVGIGSVLTVGGAWATWHNWNEAHE